MSGRERTDSEDEAYQEGRTAFEDGKAEDDNPYDSDTDEHLSWNDGFNDATDGEA